VNLSSDRRHAPGVVGRVSFAHARFGKLTIRVDSARKHVIVDGLAASAS
jgi:hypothetical protein